MLRHLIVAALRNLNANRLQSAIAIVGLSLGIAAAVIMGLVIRNQLTFDHFIPGYERTYMALSSLSLPGRSAAIDDTTNHNAAKVLQLNVPEIEGAARLELPPANAAGESLARLKRGEITADEVIYWADPNVFAVLPLPAFKGDLAKALSQPDGIVLPRSAARKYFGRDDAVGQIIQVDGHAMTVRAVIEDLPGNGTSLQSGIFASGLAAFSPLAQEADIPNGFLISVKTYVRIKPGASIAAVERRVPELINKLSATKMVGYTMLLVGVDQLPLYEGLHPGAKTKLAVAGIVGALILLIASINFVNLLTARAARRALEVGVRKVCGAGRRMLVLQFLGESVLTVFFATCLAVALTEWILPSANAFLQTGARLDYWQNPAMLGVFLAGVVVLGLLSGVYPAFVLSSFRPAGVLKGALQHSSGGSLVRNALVVLQFAILIALVVATTVIYQQNLYATHEGLRGNIDQMLVVRGGCKPAFRAELRKLPGVAGVSCAAFTFLTGFQVSQMRTATGETILVNQMTLDPGMFALYGIKPLAGSLPPATTAGDYRPDAAPAYILNEAAVRRFGFASPQAAIGQTLPKNLGPAAPPAPGQPRPEVKTIRVPIVAVVPDFSFKPISDQPILPIAYVSNPLANRALVSVKLKGQQIPETLAAIDRLWAAANPGVSISRFFLSDHMQELYLDMLRQAQLFGVFSGIAIFLACLGLLGLSLSVAERRTKEIGIRKAMGAGSGDIVRLLLWQFTKPVLWANLIAWPVAWYAMDRWLSGFAYHVVLSPLVFVWATFLAVIVALLTVAVQSILVARAVPAASLRYE